MYGLMFTVSTDFKKFEGHVPGHFSMIKQGICPRGLHKDRSSIDWKAGILDGWNSQPAKCTTAELVRCYCLLVILITFKCCSGKFKFTLSVNWGDLTQERARSQRPSRTWFANNEENLQVPQTPESNEENAQHVGISTPLLAEMIAARAAAIFARDPVATPGIRR
ncbi:hypothetical protein ACFX16_028663 [Malus domestica]